jgi:DNA polymerase-3 subunit alpha
MSFVHLHVHSHLSLLDSTVRIPDLVKAATDAGMPAIALTDHVNLFGAVQFMKACKKASIKPIFGAELVLRDPDLERPAHLIVLARTREGFANLRTLVSRSYTEGLVERTATITRDALAAHANGLTALSGCLGGEVPQALLRGDDEGARIAADWYSEVFGTGHFYLELQANRLVEQETTNSRLVELSRETGIPLVATNNVHYLSREDAKAHAVLVAIDLRRNLSREQIDRLPLNGFHMASAEEMTETFADVPEALANTLVIADSVEGITLETSEKLHFPNFAPPGGVSTEDYLATLSREGLARRLSEARALGREPDEHGYVARLDHELQVILQLNYDAYYLIVWDFINWARDREIPVGPGRGSGAGSLVAYALGITDVDPLRYDLLFERFLNPERVSPPDFDIDFCVERRDQVFQYVTEKYGRERVGQIITFGSLKAKAVVKDVARVMGLSFQQGDQITKLIPVELDMTLDKAWDKEPRLRELIESEPDLQMLWEISRRLEGLNRQAGKHAAGVVIADRPIRDYAPLFVTDDGSVVTQFNMKDLDPVGLIKFDFLGLMALTVTENAVRSIRARLDPAFRIEDIPLDDAKVFRLVSAGATAGVFQLETAGITKLVKRVKPDCIEDIIAVIALFRPGPLGSGMVEEFIAVKHGLKSPEYAIPELEPILRDTYGTILYQEQIMRITQNLGGFSLGRADNLRRAMGKKDKDELEAQREPFLAGAAQRNIDPEAALQLFDKMTFFAEYGFNKSHSAAYAYVTYRMAYLKAHFPTDFLCAVLTAEKGDQIKVMRFIKEAGDLGIPVNPPDVNRSEADFTVQDDTTDDGTRKAAIRFGLTAVKGIGASAVDSILLARQEGHFTSVTDFLARIDTRKVNKRAIEALIKCGALDGFGHTRASLSTHLDQLIDSANSRRNDMENGQMGLFDAVPGAKVADVSGPPHVPEWPFRQLLALEKEAIGYYVSGHPLDSYQDQIARSDVTNIADLSALDDGEPVSIAGIVIARSEKLTKANQSRIVFVTLEDKTGQVECFVGSRTYTQWEPVSAIDDPLFFQGTVAFEGDERKVKITVNRIERLELARRLSVRALVLRLDLNSVGEAAVERVRQIAAANRGPCPLELRLILPGAGEMDVRAGGNWGVMPADSVIEEFERLLGAGAALFV